MWTLQRIHMLSQRHRHHRRRHHFLHALLKLESLSLLIVGTASALKLAQWLRR